MVVFFGVRVIEGYRVNPPDFDMGCTIGQDGVLRVIDATASTWDYLHAAKLKSSSALRYAIGRCIPPVLRKKYLIISRIEREIEANIDDVIAGIRGEDTGKSAVVYRDV